MKSAFGNAYFIVLNLVNQPVLAINSV
jgi:hypothetical protein